MATKKIILLMMIGRAYAGFIYANSNVITLDGEQENGLQELPGELSLDGNLRIGTNHTFISKIYSELPWKEEIEERVYFKKDYSFPCFVILNEECEDDEVRVSDRLVKNYYNGNQYTSLYKALLLQYEFSEGSKLEEAEWLEDKCSMLGLSKIDFGNRIVASTLMRISDKVHSSGAYVIEVGKTMFDRIYPQGESYEAALFFNGDMIALTEELEQRGYQLATHKNVYQIKSRIYWKWEAFFVNEEGESITVNESNYQDYVK